MIEKYSESRRTLLKVAPFLLTTPFLLSACIDLNDRDYAIKNYLESKGLWGEHPLVDLRDIPGFAVRGEIGGFITFSGSFEGQSRTMLQFAWQKTEDDGQTIISEVPMDMIIFNTRLPENVRPNVSFRFNFGRIYNNSNIGQNITLIEGQRSQYPVFGSDNPNDYLKAGKTDIVDINMSQRDFETFRNPRTRS